MAVGDARASAAEWFVLGPDRKPFGPYSVEKLREYVAGGRITRDTFVHRRGTKEWVRASTVPELFPAASTEPPNASGPGAPPPPPGQPLIDRVSRRVAELTDTETVDRPHMKGLFREVGRPFALGMLKDRRCLAPIIAVMLLHATWNSPLPALVPFLLGYLALDAVAWIIAVGMMLGRLRDIREAGGVVPYRIESAAFPL